MGHNEKPINNARLFVSPKTRIILQQKIEERFINAIECNDQSLVHELLPRIKNDLPQIDQRRNLVELIRQSNYWHPSDLIQRVVDNCISPVDSSTLLFCLQACNEKVIRLLLSYGSDPNAQFCGISMLGYIFHYPHDICASNVYWLIIYGVDFSVKCNFENCFHNVNCLFPKLGYHVKCKTCDKKIIEINCVINRGINDMKKGVIDCNCLLLDLYNIVFEYLMWIKF